MLVGDSGDPFKRMRRWNRPVWFERHTVVNAFHNVTHTYEYKKRMRTTFTDMRLSE